MRIRSSVLSAAVAVACALALSACSGKDGGVKAAAPPAPSKAAASSPAATEKSSGGSKPEGDVKVNTCRTADGTSYPQAELTVTNHSSKTSNYLVSVEFVNGSGLRVAEGAAAANDLAPGQPAAEKAMGLAEVAGKFTCRVTKVTRYAAP